MKMKTNPVLKKAALLGSVGAAILATSAQAATFTAPRGNIIFGTVEVGAPSGFEFIVDLGGNNAFQAYTGIAAPNQGARLLGGSSVSEAYQGITFASENRFTSADLTATFGNLNDLQ